MSASRHDMTPVDRLRFRPLTSADQTRLWHWLHVALWDPPPAGPRPLEVLEAPGVRIYAQDWGRPTDVGVVAQVDGVDAGACWMRLLPAGVGLAFVDERTPQLGIALSPPYQHRGIGRALMEAALRAAARAGYRSVSLTVHARNPAQRLYEACGFRKIEMRNSHHLMVAQLESPILGTASRFIETRRLQLRPMGRLDVPDLLAVYGDAEAMRWVGDGRPITPAECEQWVEVTDRNFRVRGYGMFAVVERESSRVVGFCGLVHPGGQPTAELKYAFVRQAWGQGFATEAATALLRHAPEAFGLHEVIATAAPENEASHRVLLKTGMRREALRRNEDGSSTQLFAWRAEPARPAP